MIQELILKFLNWLKGPKADGRILTGEKPALLTDAARVVRAAEAKGAILDKGEGEVNIIYIEGCNYDLTPNGNEPDKWNDLRTIIKFQSGVPTVSGKWQATTEPGTYFTEHRLNERGAARIALGQFKAWKVGFHRQNHEALVQTGDVVTVFRDDNEDYKREGDVTDTGYFGINQHWGYDISEDSIGNASAGCLVGRTKQGHREFMALVKQDVRYQADKKFIFPTTIIEQSSL